METSTSSTLSPPAVQTPSMMDRLSHRVGRELGVSPWLRIDQNLIDCFAACTGDQQWIHVDVERARQGPFRGTIAHGWLTASLLAPWALDALAQTVSPSQTLNYGVDRLRFLQPVPCGSRLRGRLALDALQPRGPGQALLSLGCTVEIEGQAKPALVATVLLLLVVAAG